MFSPRNLYGFKNIKLDENKSYKLKEEELYDKLKIKILERANFNFGFNLSMKDIDILICIYICGIINILINESNQKYVLMDKNLKYISFILAPNMIICLNIETFDIEFVFGNDITENMFNCYTSIDNFKTHYYFKLTAVKFGMKFYNDFSVIFLFNNIFYSISKEPENVIKYIFEFVFREERGGIK